MTFPHGLGVVQFLADHRHPWLTSLFQLCTLLGEVEGYVLLIALVYVAFDKRLAIELAVLTLAAMCANHVLKTLLRNPRPFVADGSWSRQWAVSPGKAADLVTEFSTPSGHGMAGGAFYVYLHQRARHRAVRAACVALLLLTGLSRPYLGVHYLEDVLLGWVLGGALAIIALRCASTLERAWMRLSHPRQIALAVAASLLPWLVTRAAAGWGEGGQPTAFVGYAGFLTGIAIAQPLEARLVGFDPRGGTVARKALRWIVAVALVLGTLALLDAAFTPLAADATPLGDALRYLRYAATAVVAMFVAPLLLVKLGWADRPETPAQQTASAA